MSITENNRLVELFLEITSIDALSGYEKSLADYIKTFTSKLNLITIEDNSFTESGSNTGNLICKIGTGGNFLLLSHMDTARPTGSVKPVIQEDRIISDGTTVLGVDNRAGITVLLFMLEKIVREQISVKDFTVAFTTCEETTLAGSKYLAVDWNIKKAFVFDSSHRPGNFIYSACGSMGFRVEIIGVASHSALAPEKGINSIAAAARAISRIKQGKLNKDTTVNIGRINGGSAVNVIPELTIIEGEIRSFKNSTIEKINDQIKKVFEEETKKISAAVKYESVWDFLPYTISEDSEVYADTMNVIKKTGLQPVPKISLGGSDANSLNGRGIPSVNLGIGAQNPHSNHEFIMLEDLYKSAEIAIELVKN